LGAGGKAGDLLALDGLLLVDADVGWGEGEGIDSADR
jgi:hypothetical protein